MSYTSNHSLPIGHILTPNDRRQNRSYKILKVLGQGSFAYVYEALDGIHQRRVAIKELFPHKYVHRNCANHTVHPQQGQENFFKKLKSNFANEAGHVARVNSPYVVQVLDTFVANNTFYFAMPYLHGVTLDNYIGRLTAQQIKPLLYKCLEGLVAIHSAGYVHRDITPSNIFIRENFSPIIIDLGSARDATNDNMTLIYTPAYAAPEQLDNTNKNIKPVSDIYGIAASFYHVITGDKPDRNPAHILNEKLIRSPLGGQLGHRFISLLASALEIDKRARLSSAEKWLQGLREHPLGVQKTVIDNRSYTPSSVSSPCMPRYVSSSAASFRWPRFVMNDPILTTAVLIVSVIIFFAIIL